MENFTKDIISVLQYLLPGFLAAWVFYGFTSFPKPSEFERVIQALIFTLIIQSIVFIEEIVLLKMGTFMSLGKWNGHSELFYSSITAVFLGALLVRYNDKFYEIARGFGFTIETSYPSEWYGIFKNNVTYIVLHLKDERRLYGWPMEWPSEPSKGHFSLVQASWIDNNNELIPLTGVSSIMIRGEDVIRVEFLEKQ